MGGESHISEQQFKQATAWDHQMNQTASALHDELAHNDIAGLHQTLNSVSRNDLEIVEADYKAIGEKAS
jgi:hypothetical protein